MKAAFGPLAAAGERTRVHGDEYALLVESMLEGYLLHYASGRIVCPHDPDLRLLCGDHLYAFGLARLAQLGDLDAVAVLADLISLCAHVHAAAGRGDAGEAWQLTGSLWALASLAVAGGHWDGQREAMERARAAGRDAAENALAQARLRAEQLDVSDELEHALIAFEMSLLNARPTT